MKLAREAGFFALGGVIGFIVDAGIVHVLVRQWALDPYLARVPSFLVAATVTWWWNRSLTFAHRRHLRGGQEWLRWIGVMSLGAMLNYGVYALAIGFFPTVRAWPALGVAAGSAVAAVVNYSAARGVVFRRAQ